MSKFKVGDVVCYVGKSIAFLRYAHDRGVWARARHLLHRESYQAAV